MIHTSKAVTPAGFTDSDQNWLQFFQGNYHLALHQQNIHHYIYYKPMTLLKICTTHHGFDRLRYFLTINRKSDDINGISLLFYANYIRLGMKSFVSTLVILIYKLT